MRGEEREKLTNKLRGDEGSGRVMSPRSIHVDDLESLLVVVEVGGGHLLLLLPGHVGVPVHVILKPWWCHRPGQRYIQGS